MADDREVRPRKKKSATARRKFSTPAQARAQVEAIAVAQRRYRRAKRRKASDEIDAPDTEAEGIIIDSIEKSEQGWKNALRSVRRPEDLDGFD